MDMHTLVLFGMLIYWLTLDLKLCSIRFWVAFILLVVLNTSFQRCAHTSHLVQSLCRQLRHTVVLAGGNVLLVDGDGCVHKLWLNNLLVDHWLNNLVD